jgi:homoserine O-acetyltransferase
MQIEAIRADPNFRGGDYYDAPPGGGPHRGLGIARRIGHLSYRSEAELQERFGRRTQGTTDPLEGGTFAVESYFDHHADKLARRFDANSYVVLSEAMNYHDVGRDRGGVAAALQAMRAAVFVAGVDSDRLYPLYLQEEIAALVPGAPPVAVIRSLYGHDSFLIEAEFVGRFVARALAASQVGLPRR